MKVAERLKNLPTYMFAVLGEKIRKKRKDELDIISFGIGVPDLPTPEFIVDSLCEAARASSISVKLEMGYLFPCATPVFGEMDWKCPKGDLDSCQDPLIKTGCRGMVFLL